MEPLLRGFLHSTSLWALLLLDSPSARYGNLLLPFPLPLDCLPGLLSPILLVPCLAQCQCPKRLLSEQSGAPCAQSDSATATWPMQCVHRYCPWPKKPTPNHSPAPQLMCGGFSLCPSPFLARWPPLGSTSSGGFWESQPVIRALISRTSCQPLPEVGAGRGGKQGQSKVKFKAWEIRKGSCREMDSQTLPAQSLSRPLSYR